MADIRPDRLTTCQSEQKSVVSRRPSVIVRVLAITEFAMGSTYVALPIYTGLLQCRELRGKVLLCWAAEDRNAKICDILVNSHDMAFILSSALNKCYIAHEAQGDSNANIF
jgi:hypothetical protein